MLPHVSSFEQEMMEAMERFKERSDLLPLRLRQGETVPFSHEGIKGDIVLKDVKMGVFAWGGCGNNIGNYIDVHVRFGSKEANFEGTLRIGPKPIVFEMGPLLLVLETSDEAERTAMVFIGIKR